jgi:hypothetical protein
MSERVLSWQTTFVGDPLYRPYKGAEFLDDRPDTGEWAEYRAGAKAWAREGREAGGTMLRASAKKLRSGVIAEGLGLLELTADGRDRALEAFALARSYYTDPGDICRAGIHELLQLRAARRDDDALALAKKLTDAFPHEPAIEVVKMLAPAPKADAAGR